MIYYELDDFEFLLPDGSGLGCFAPVFFIPIEWAYKRGFLEESLVTGEVFITNHKKLVDGLIMIDEFVANVIDYKMIDGWFSENIRDFIDVYIRDITSMLVRYFKCSLSEVPNDWKKYGPIFNILDDEYNAFRKANKIDGV